METQSLNLGLMLYTGLGLYIAALYVVRALRSNPEPLIWKVRFIRAAVALTLAAIVQGVR